MKSYLEKYAPSTAQKNINLGILYELKFPLPPLEEQKAIVEKVTALMELCDGLEQEVQHSQEQSELLMKSCLREVFEGESA
jgi:type I restriction enzyme S subunit